VISGFSSSSNKVFQPFLYEYKWVIRHRSYVIRRWKGFASSKSYSGKIIKRFWRAVQNEPPLQFWCVSVRILAGGSPNRPYSSGDHDAGWRQQAYTVGVDRFDRPAPAGSAMPMSVGDDTAIP
jgi:hypothetical protein